MALLPMISRDRLTEILKHLPEDVKLGGKYDVFVDGEASVIWDKDHDIAIYLKKANRLVFMDRDDYQRYKLTLREHKHRDR